MSDRLRQAVAALEHSRTGAAGNGSSPQEPDLFSQLESVADHAGAQWRDRAQDLVHWIAMTRQTFTVCDLDPYLPPTADRRAVGWVLRRGARNGWYAAIGYESGGPSRHGRPVVVWRSLINRGTAA
jgi:hypothetical protein